MKAVHIMIYTQLYLFQHYLSKHEGKERKIMCSSKDRTLPIQYVERKYIYLMFSIVKNFYINCQNAKTNDEKEMIVPKLLFVHYAQ